jgi:hypothetical protein
LEILQPLLSLVFPKLEITQQQRLVYVPAASTCVTVQPFGFLVTESGHFEFCLRQKGWILCCIYTFAWAELLPTCRRCYEIFFTREGKMGIITNGFKCFIHAFLKVSSSKS